MYSVLSLLLYARNWNTMSFNLWEFSKQNWTSEAFQFRFAIELKPFTKPWLLVIGLDLIWFRTKGRRRRQFQQSYTESLTIMLLYFRMELYFKPAIYYYYHNAFIFPSISFVFFSFCLAIRKKCEGANFFCYCCCSGCLLSFLSHNLIFYLRLKLN